MAYEEHVYRYVKVHEHRASKNGDDMPLPSSAFSQSDEPGPSHDRADALKLQIRYGERTITIGVRPTAKCTAVVENVLCKFGKSESEAKKARIVVDGEKLNPESEIGEADVEDGDLVDIVDA